MELTLFLAQVLGLYCICVAVAMIAHRNDVNDMVHEFAKSKVLVFFSGSIALLIGLLIVVSHNVWALDIRGAVTLMGWLAVVKGVSRLIYPRSVQRFSREIIKGHWYWFILVLVGILGVYLTYAGFTQG